MSSLVDDLEWSSIKRLQIENEQRRIRDAHLAKLELRRSEIMNFTDRASQEEVAPDPDVDAEEDLCYLFDRSCLLNGSRAVDPETESIRRAIKRFTISHSTNTNPEMISLRLALSDFQIGDRRNFSPENRGVFDHIFHQVPLIRQDSEPLDQSMSNNIDLSDTFLMDTATEKLSHDVKMDEVDRVEVPSIKTIEEMVMQDTPELELNPPQECMDTQAEEFPATAEHSATVRDTPKSPVTTTSDAPIDDPFFHDLYEEENSKGNHGDSIFRDQLGEETHDAKTTTCGNDGYSDSDEDDLYGEDNEIFGDNVQNTATNTSVSEEEEEEFENVDIPGLYLGKDQQLRLKSGSPNSQASNETFFQEDSPKQSSLEPLEPSGSALGTLGKFSMGFLQCETLTNFNSWVESRPNQSK